MNLMLAFIMSLLQIRSTPVSSRLPSPAILMFDRLARGLLPRFNRPPITCDNNKSNHATLKSRQPKSNNETDTHVNFSPLPIESTVAVQCKDGGP